MDIIRKHRFEFSFDPVACRECHGNCCIGESGCIWVSKKDMLQISDFLGLDIDDFVSDYVREIGNRFSLKEVKIGGSLHCAFFDEGNRQCSIYGVRPTQCRTFPFWDYFKNHIDEVVKECPGVKLIKGSPRAVGDIEDRCP